MKQRTERVIFEVPAHLKRAFATILASKKKTQAEVLRKFVESYVKKASK
jgi:hypothetical protein